jgi:5-methylcytosine-specific restriction enzyme A
VGKITLCREAQVKTAQKAPSKPRQNKGRTSFFYCFMSRSSRLRLATAPPPKFSSETRCGLCERLVASTSRHHLVPRAEGGRYGETVDLCQPCHSSVHRFLSNRELARRYATVEALRQAEELQGFLHWVRRQRVERIRNRRGAD